MDAYEFYEKAYAEALLGMPSFDATNKKDRKDIKRVAAECLGLNKIKQPKLKVREAGEIDKERYVVELLRAESWDNVYGSAHFYRPKDSSVRKFPLVVICCGHGKEGKLNPGYQSAAAFMAENGFAVLVPDNIGQGEREPMGHWEKVMPFACGITLQGLIVTEMLSWIDWAETRPDVDEGRIGAAGNSGGGKLTMFLAAFAENIAVLSSSGYPCTFDFVARKEKRQCACNIVPGIVGSIEMHHIYSLFAPRPLFIFQGKYDNLFPEDIFLSVARKIRNTYRKFEREDDFEFATYPGTHSWDYERVKALAGFMSKRLLCHGLEHEVPENKLKLMLMGDSGKCYDKWPSAALDTDALSMALTGENYPADIKLYDIFRVPPEYDKQSQRTVRADNETVLAQFEAFLNKNNR
jgi:dienelactone hydrolase